MTQAELQALVEATSLKFFGRPFTHQAVFNRRLKSTGGRYHLADHHLDFNPTLFAEITSEEQLGIIKHELCHYHLHLMGKGYQHRDQDFKRLLKQTGGSRYSPNRKATSSNCHHYRCEKCGLEYHRQRRLDTKKYACGKCRGKLVEFKLTASA